MCALSESRINTDSAREGDSVLPFAPEERYVYSSATPPIPALQRSAMCALSESRITRITRRTQLSESGYSGSKDLQDKGREAEKARDRKARQFIGVLSD